MTIVFKPNYPLLDLSEFLAGSLMLIFSLLVTLKINRGSKNYFAFTLMFFTAAYGVGFISIALEEALRKEVTTADGIKYEESFYWLFACSWLLSLCDL